MYGSTSLPGSTTHRAGCTLDATSQFHMALPHDGAVAIPKTEG